MGEAFSSGVCHERTIGRLELKNSRKKKKNQALYNKVERYGGVNQGGSVGKYAEEKKLNFKN